MGWQRLEERFAGSQGLSEPRTDVCSLSQERAEVGEAEEVKQRPGTSSRQCCRARRSSKLRLPGYDHVSVPPLNGVQHLPDYREVILAK